MDFEARNSSKKVIYLRIFLSPPGVSREVSPLYRGFTHVVSCLIILLCPLSSSAALLFSSTSHALFLCFLAFFVHRKEMGHLLSCRDRLSFSYY